MRGDAVEGRSRDAIPGKQMMFDRHDLFSDDLRGTVDQAVLGIVHGAFGGILDRRHAIGGLARFHRRENFIDGAAIEQFAVIAELAQGRFLGECARRSQVGDSGGQWV